MNRSTLSVAALLLALLARRIAASEVDEYAAQVSHADGKWTIAGQRNKVSLDESDLRIQIQAGPVGWAMVPSGAKDLLVKSKGQEFFLRLADAKRIEIVPYHPGFKSGVKIRLSDWRQKDSTAVDLTLYLTICLEGKNEELVFDVTADEHEAPARRLDWPPALEAGDVDYTVLSNGRGNLLPRNWPAEFNPIRAMKAGKLSPDDKSEVQSNVIECWSMSWWGFQKGKSAMMVIVETPNDAAYQFEHPAGGPTVIGPRWRASLGRFGYSRTARMCFFPEGEYVILAKRYRQYVKETGLFVSLPEKIKRTPAVSELIGTPLMRMSILKNIKPGSFLYDANDPSKNRTLRTFDERIGQLRELKAKGIDHLHVCLTGWPHYGYDRQHPDELPPPPDAGGWEGLKRLAEACRNLGYALTFHDQYRDYYLDAPSYDPQFAAHEENAEAPPQAFPGTRFGQRKDGAIPVMDHWEGGAQAYLNSHFMVGFLRRNYDMLRDHGIKPNGIYLDVFGYVPPDEDFNPEHPVTRSEGLKDRADCYNWSRQHLGIVGTEAACDWTIPYVDISSPLGPGKCVPVPLFNLVYHDAIITPYRTGDLHGFLNGGLPQGDSISATDKDMVFNRELAALHRRVALFEMTGHEFLDKERRKERTTFADGTTVTIDWDAGTHQVNPELK